MPLLCQEMSSLAHRVTDKLSLKQHMVKRVAVSKIIFIERDNTRHVAEFEAGITLMQIALDNAVPGIDGDCGGECACGTCHMVIADEWFGKTGAVNDAEEQMLSMTPERARTSRLGCQVKTSEDMDGLIIKLPEFQM